MSKSWKQGETSSLLCLSLASSIQTNCTLIYLLSGRQLSPCAALTNMAGMGASPSIIFRHCWGNGCWDGGVYPIVRFSRGSKQPRETSHPSVVGRGVRDVHCNRGVSPCFARRGTREGHFEIICSFYVAIDGSWCVTQIDLPIQRKRLFGTHHQRDTNFLGHCSHLHCVEVELLPVEHLDTSTDIGHNLSKMVSVNGEVFDERRKM